MSKVASRPAAEHRLDTESYLSRIGLRGAPTLGRIHLAHVTSIPFENLDPHQGLPVSLDRASLAGKLLAGRRGGICFEQNELLKATLEEMGMRVDVFLARVRIGSAPYRGRPRSHPVLRVWDEGVPWLADVGFGMGGLLEPLPLEPGVEVAQGGWRFRLTEDGREQVLQVATPSGWTDLYGYVPEPMPPIEVEVSSWFTTSHPESRFVKGLCVSRHWPNGKRAILSDWSGELTLTQASPERTEEEPVEWEHVPELLASKFELPGFVLVDGNRLAAA